MFEKILVPTDFSSYSQIIINSLNDFKKLKIKEVVLLYVIKPVETFSDIEIEEAYWLGIKADAELMLDKIKLEIESLGIKVKTLIKTDHPYAGIISAAEEENAGLILIGSHGKSRDKKLHLGSVAENVLRYSKIPTLIMKIIDDEIKFPFSKILFPTDFSYLADKALEAVKELAGGKIQEVVVVHIQNIEVHKLHPNIAAEIIEEAGALSKERLEEIQKELEKLGVKVKTILREGVPFVEINNIAEEENAGCIVIGSHGSGKVKEMLLGSVSHRVARKAETSVLVITPCE